MNLKIDQNQGKVRDELAPGFRPWLLFLTLATIALVFLTPVTERPMHRTSDEFRLTVFPWIHAAGITISNGLEAFSGKALATLTTGQRASILTGLLLGFIVGPTLLLIAWREQVRGLHRRWHPPAMLLGGVLVAAVVLPTFFSVILRWRTEESLREAQSTGFQRDSMIRGLHLIGRDARQYRILPQSLNGGGGSFSGYAIPDSLVKSDNYSCMVTETKDTLITLLARSKTSYPLTAMGTMSRAGIMRFEFREEEVQR